MNYFSRLGLEIHVQLKTRTKLFCSCPVSPTERPNQNVCPVCLGYPGVLPRLNREAIVQGIRISQALEMTIANEIRFDRKQYFYPDLSKNYQTSQFYNTVGRNGSFQIEVRGKLLKIRIREAHLEEDAAKLMHALDESMVDYNRGGTPLLEIVTEPDFRIGEEAEIFLRELRLLLQTIGASEANMELGQLRCDANVSVSPDREKSGTRTELKNLNSPRFIRLAVDYEIQRQIKVVESGGRVIQETRSWNENRDITESMRSKEEAHDYRYQPEPDLWVVDIRPDSLEKIKNSIPELPNDRIERLSNAHGLSETLVRELVVEPKSADFFEKTVKRFPDAETVANWILNQVREIHKGKNLTFADSPLKPDVFADLLEKIRDETISTTNGRKALKLHIETGSPLAKIVREKGFELCSEKSRIESWINSALESNPKQVEQLKQGNRKIFEFLVGQVQKAGKGKVNPRLLRIMMQNQLDLSQIAVINMGGAISAGRDEEGIISSPDPDGIPEFLEELRKRDVSIHFENMGLPPQLSENLTPREWFLLSETLQKLFSEERFRGIMVLHGLDTISYTSTLMRWLHPRPPVPVVFTGSIKSGRDPGSDANTNISGALKFIEGTSQPGFWVHVGDSTFPAFNLRMTSVDEKSLEILNLTDSGRSLVIASKQWKAPAFSREKLEQVVSNVLILKIYPGFDPSLIQTSLPQTTKYLILELYDTGTGNTRTDCANSLLPLIHEINKHDGLVFGTSQLGVPVDMSQYETSQDLWNSGVVPLGGLITETAYTKLIAALLLEDDRDRIVHRMINEEFSL